MAAVADRAAPALGGRPPESPLEAAGDLAGSLSERFAAWVELVLVEGRAAALGLSTMLALAVVTGVLAVSAWIFLAFAAAAWLRQAGAPEPALLAAIAGLNLLAAIGTWQLISRLSRYLTFPATRRRLAGGGGGR